VVRNHGHRQEIDTMDASDSPTPTRRLLVTGGALAAAALAADAVAHPQSAAADDGDPIRLSKVNRCSRPTQLRNSDLNANPKITYALEVVSSVTALRGRATGSGYGVIGDSETGIGVLAKGGRIGLRVDGRAEFSTSGFAVVRALTSSVSVPGPQLGWSSLMLAVLQQHRAGVWVVSATRNSDQRSFTIRLNAPVLADTRVAWFIVN
jgi:hypothetical protein